MKPLCLNPPLRLRSSAVKDTESLDMMGVCVQRVTCKTAKTHCNCIYLDPDVADEKDLTVGLVHRLLQRHSCVCRSVGPSPCNLCRPMSASHCWGLSPSLMQ